MAKPWRSQEGGRYGHKDNMVALRLVIERIFLHGASGR